MRRETLRRAAPAILLAVIVLLPFGGKAFTIDDTLFMEQATHTLSDPLHPTAFETVWSEIPFPTRVSRIMPTGAVGAWVLVPAALAGGSEWLAHAVELAFFVLAIVATVSLALRLALPARTATIAGLLLAATPAALGMAGTAMPDVPAMALGVAGLERLVAWKQERRAHQAVLAALLLGLAPLARSHLILLLGIGVLLFAGDYLASRNWREQKLWTWTPVLGALLITAAVTIVTRDPSPGAGDIATSAGLFSGFGHLGTNVVAFATHWVLALPLALPWIAIRYRALLRRWWVLLIATAVASAFITSRPGVEKWMYVAAPIAGLGAAALFDVFADSWERRDSLQLTLGLWLLAALPVAIYVHLPSKYLLASAPAAAILVARSLERIPESVARWTAGTVIALGALLGVAILRADSRFAGFSRRAAAELIAPRVEAGQRVWFNGYWGFKWYAAAAGGRVLTISPPYPEPGDFVVITRSAVPSPKVQRMLETNYPRATRVAHIEDHEPGGRVMDPTIGAGFYSNGWGYFPWVWADNRLDWFELWRIE